MAPVSENETGAYGNVEVVCSGYGFTTAGVRAYCHTAPTWVSWGQYVGSTPFGWFGDDDLSYLAPGMPAPAWITLYNANGTTAYQAISDARCSHAVSGHRRLEGQVGYVPFHVPAASARSWPADPHPSVPDW